MTKQYAGIHDEFVKVIQGASSLYRIGSDRINNAEHYTRKHAEAMMDFESPELHPDTVKMYRNMAAKFADENAILMPPDDKWLERWAKRNQCFLMKPKS